MFDVFADDSDRDAHKARETTSPEGPAFWFVAQPGLRLVLSLRAPSELKGKSAGGNALAGSRAFVRLSR